MSKNMLTIEEIKYQNNCGIALSIIADIVKRARQGMQPVPDPVGFEKWANTPSAEYMNASGEQRLRIEWQAAQSALLADPMVLDLRGLEWPDEALSIVCTFSALTVETHEQYAPHLVRAIKRPTPVWRPKDGEWVWRVEDTTHSLIRWSKVSEGTFFAKPINYVDENVWTREQFLARGDVWEVQ